jgi:redox-sensitive bicupin YhaK (pirin superfamily)
MRVSTGRQDGWQGGGATERDMLSFMPLHRPAASRGHADHGWLDSWHTFSFADYHDPAWMGFSTLRVINEDIVAGGTGFGMHPHRDMEILTWVLSGRLRHQDSLGNTADLTPGEVQRMTAGTGIVHSETNPAADPVHLLQIWIQPSRRGLAPGYAQRRFDPQGRFQAVATPDGRDGSLTLNADATLHLARFAPDAQAVLPVRPGRRAWLHLARGTATLGGLTLAAGDGLGLAPGEGGELVATVASEVLLFDLP